MNEKIAQEALELWIDSGTAEREHFDDAYRGCWPTFGEYLAEEVEDMQRGWPEEAVRYFNRAQYERDAQHSYTLCEASNGGVHIFLDL